MNRSIEEELSSFIRVWMILGSMMIIVSLGMVLLSWPDRWLSWFVFSLVLLFGFLMFKHTRMARRALDVLENGRQEPCLVEIRKESGDDRDDVKGTVCRESGDGWNVSFTPPPWNVVPILEKRLQAKAYFEPDTEYPLVVVVDGGHLWAERVPTRLKTPAKNG